jgi:hypothetical protein
MIGLCTTQERSRFVRDTRNLVGCLPIELSSDLGLRPVVLAIAERLQLASAEVSPGPWRV